MRGTFVAPCLPGLSFLPMRLSVKPRWRRLGGIVWWGYSTDIMKAFLQRNNDGRFYQKGGAWVEKTSEALAFASLADAEAYRCECHVEASQAVSRLDPGLLARLSARAPGRFQMGE